MPRPKSYDVEEMLEMVGNIFRQKGYAGTSMSDLVEETGLNRSSIYHAFPDKYNLFLAALKQYLQQHKDILSQSLDKVPPSQNYLADRLKAPSSEPCCLAVRAAIEFGEEDEQVQQLLSQHEEATLETLQENLAQELDEAAPEDSREEALQLIAVKYGMEVARVAGWSRKALRLATP